MSGVNSNTSAQFTGLPSAQAQLVNPSGGITHVWYRFLQALWLQISSGTPNSVTLQTAHSTATGAALTASNNTTSIQAEVQRATQAENNIQANVDALSTTVTGNYNTIQGQITNLQSQINTINQRLTNAGIP